jgi:glycerophosphoryl diester phosphodiesterase
VNLRHPSGRPLVIGHRGAAAVAPENTLESLAAAVEAGADLVEFDVGAGLVLGHSGGPAGDGPNLDNALAYLAGEQIGVHIDLKHDGIERDVAAAVGRHGLEDRVVVSSTRPRALRRLAAAAPGLTRAISYPHDTYGASRLPFPRPLVRASAVGLRPVMRVRLLPLLSSSRAGVLSLRHELVSRRLVEAVHARGAQFIAWTVNDPENVARLAALGVDAVVSDDPEMAHRALATLNSP